MACLHIESSDPCTITQQKPNDEGGGIQEAWAQIENRSGGGGGGYFAGESKTKLEKRKSQVLLKGYVESTALDDDDITRAKSLTDDDLEELKGCLDLGFGFSYDEIPELCNTLPALELCYSMSQKFSIEEKQNNHQKSSPPVEAASPPQPPPSTSSTASPIANWKISSPGDNPEEVKARLKYWAQAVACTVRLCS